MPHSCDWLIKANKSMDLFMSLNVLGKGVQHVQTSLSEEISSLQTRQFTLGVTLETTKKGLETTIAVKQRQIEIATSNVHQLENDILKRETQVHECDQKLDDLNKQLKQSTSAYEDDEQKAQQDESNLENDVTAAVSLSQNIGSKIPADFKPTEKQSLMLTIGDMMQNLELAQNSEQQTRNMTGIAYVRHIEILKSMINSISVLRASLVEMTTGDQQSVLELKSEMATLNTDIETVTRRHSKLSTIANAIQLASFKRSSLIQATIEKCTELLWNIHLAKSCATP
jgi:DNA repair exonuclease SbcCD ATPase subunit